MADLGHQTEPLRRHALDRNPEPTDAAVCHDPRTTSGDSEWARLLEACFAELHEAVESGDIARTSPLHEAVAELALIERGAIKPASRRGQKALRVGRLCLAQRLIARHLSQAALSPAMVADLLGVSVRHLHLLFETTGTSFSLTVAAQRMRQIRLLLREAPQRPIAEIAHACGFASMATFYRVFGANTGLTPGQFRDREAATLLTAK
jgi:AraC-like DNA-binding protein